MDVGIWVMGIEFLFMRLEVLAVEVANVYCEGAIVSKLVGARATDSERGVCTSDYDDFSFHSSGNGIRAT